MAAAAVAPLHAVSTIVEIDAPPAAVWRHVVQFSELPPGAIRGFHGWRGLRSG
jgi:hypothetical protein